MTRTGLKWHEAALLACAGIVLVTLIGLGNWQVRRLAWKTDLIEAVETRAHGVPIPAPASDRFDPEASEYQRVSIAGRYLHDHTLTVKAVTELGPGSWVLTPLETPTGEITWINRGFVPTGSDPATWTRPVPDAPVSGLLRLDEPGGTLLEKNTDGRWVSRDVMAMSAAQGLGPTRPYFIDAEHVGSTSAWPRGGLTVISFPNSHLSYALTWYAMAILLVAGVIYVIRVRAYRDDDTPS